MLALRVMGQAGPVDVGLRKLGVGQPVEQIAEQGQPADRLVVEVDQCPRRPVGMGRGKHLLPRFSVSVIASARFDIDRRQLPPPPRVVEAVGEAFFLMVLVDAQPIFEQQQPVLDQVSFEFGGRTEEGVGLILAAITHHFFDPGTVVPAAVEQGDLALRREMLGVTLEIPLPLLALRRSGQSDHLALARVQGAREHIDRPALARSVASLEDDHHALAGFLDPARRVAQFLGQRVERGLILLPAEDRGAAHLRTGASAKVKLTGLGSPAPSNAWSANGPSGSTQWRNRCADHALGLGVVRPWR